MIIRVSSPEARLDVLRDLKAAGYGASAPHEDDQGDAGYTIVVTDSPGGEDGLLGLARAIDPDASVVG